MCLTPESELLTIPGIDSYETSVSMKPQEVLSWGATGILGYFLMNMLAYYTKVIASSSSNLKVKLFTQGALTC